MKEKHTFHYGWIVTAGCCIIIFYSYGLAMNVFSIFVQPIIDELSLSKAQGSSILSLINFAGILAMIVSGKLYKEFKTKTVSFVYGLLIGIGFIFFAFAKTLYNCYFAAFLIGLGWGGGSIIPVSILISRWFSQSNGLALGIATSGSGLATMIFPSILSSMIEKHGLSYSFLFQAASILILVVISHLLIKDSPSNLNLLPYTKNTRGNSIEEKRKDDELFKDTKHSKKFYKLIVVAFLVGTSVIPVIAHLSVVIISSGYKPIFAGMMVSIFGIFMVIGKIIYGIIADYFKNKAFYADIYIFSLWVLGLFSVFCLSKGNSAPLLYVILTGLGSPIGTVGIPLWTQELFGKKEYSLFFSVIILSYNFGSVIGMALPGLIADITGSYETVFVFYIVCALGAFAILKNLRSNHL